MESMDENPEDAKQSPPAKGHGRGRNVNKTVELGTEGTLRFIKLVKSQECLWNRRQPQYRNKTQQHNAWKEISKQMGIPSIQLQFKWKSLSSSYRHCRSYYSKSLRTGVPKTRIWFAYEAMRFLSDIKNCGCTKAESMCCAKQEPVVEANESMDEISPSEPSEGIEVSVPGQGSRKRATTVKLGKEGTLRFIQLMKSAECLWNRKQPQFRNKMQQYIAWKEISRRMGIPIIQLQCKWKSLGSSYRHFQSLHSKATRSGLPLTDRWYAYDAMRFLSGMAEGGDTKAESESCTKPESVFVAMESTDDDSEGLEETEEAQLFRKRAKTVDLGIEGTIRFIKLVKAAECLWNRKQPQYKNKMQQYIAWKEISRRMGLPIIQLQCKWKSLCSSYRHFHSLYSKATISGLQRWYAYDAMRFLSGMDGGDDTKPESASWLKQESIRSNIIESMDENSKAVVSVPLKGMKECGDMKTEQIPISNENALYLISLVKSHGCLWNQQDTCYENAKHRQSAWQSISKAMGHSVQAIQQKFSSLRGTYRNYCLKSRKDGGDAKPNWFAYDALRFLGDDPHYDKPLGTELINMEGDQNFSENRKVLQKIQLKPTTDVVTIVNLHNQSVICKPDNHTASKYSTRIVPKLHAQMVNPLLLKRKRQFQQGPRTEDPLQIDDPLRINFPTHVGAGSGGQSSSVQSFLRFLEHELRQLSTESMTLAQIEMHRIIGEYKLKDMLKAASPSNPKETNSMESTGTQTELLDDPVTELLNVTEFCSAELSLARENNMF